MELKFTPDEYGFYLRPAMCDCPMCWQNFMEANFPFGTKAKVAEDEAMDIIIAAITKDIGEVCTWDEYEVRFESTEACMHFVLKWS